MDCLPKKGYLIHPESYLCKVVFKSGKISYHLFDKLSFAKKFSESVSRKYFHVVAYCELLPFFYDSFFDSSNLLEPADCFISEASNA